MKQKIKNFFMWIWEECKDWHTIVMLAVVIVVMYSPVWGGYLLHAIFGWKWCSAVSTAVLVFWAGPFTPFFPVCVGITLSIKKAFSKFKQRKTDKTAAADCESKAVEIIPDTADKTNDLPDEEKISYDELFWLFMSGSIAGVVIEGLFCLMTKGHWETHVVSVFGAFNILYGLGAVLFYIGAVKLRNRPVAVRVLIMTATATLTELVCGLLLRYGLGMRAWNYDNAFLNFKGIICLGFSLVWAAAAFVFCMLYPYISAVLNKLKRKWLHVACIVLTVFMIPNIGFTGLAIFRWSERHYNVAAVSKIQQYIDSDAPDDWMQSRFVEWEFIDGDG